jgi:hypothetical protein
MKFITIKTLMEKKETNQINYEDLGIAPPDNSDAQFYKELSYNVKILEEEVLDIRDYEENINECVIEFMGGSTVQVQMSRKDLIELLEQC